MCTYINSVQDLCTARAPCIYSAFSIILGRSNVGVLTHTRGLLVLNPQALFLRSFLFRCPCFPFCLPLLNFCNRQPPNESPRVPIHLEEGPGPLERLPLRLRLHRTLAGEYIHPIGERSLQGLWSKYTVWSACATGITQPDFCAMR